MDQQNDGISPCDFGFKAFHLFLLETVVDVVDADKIPADMMSLDIGPKTAELYADDFLYDLKADPYQLNNVVHQTEYNEVKLELRNRLLNWIEKAEGYVDIELVPVTYSNIF